jgi:peptidoglycan-associated lipoprotein
MKKIIFFIPIACLLIVGCKNSSNQAWENIKTAGSYLNRGIDSLCGKYTDSRLLSSEEEFLGPMDAEYIPLDEKDLKTLFAKSEGNSPQPKLLPGDKKVPGINSFQTPKGRLSSIFKRIHFQTDDHVIKKHDDLIVVSKIANYLKKNPKTYLTIEGHCDERASAGYNMALGARRANHVRVLLIKQGVDFNRIYSISHGKERPLVLGHGEDSWKSNRRVEFKVSKKR